MYLFIQYLALGQALEDKPLPSWSFITSVTIEGISIQTDVLVVEIQFVLSKKAIIDTWASH